MPLMRSITSRRDNSFGFQNYDSSVTLLHYTGKMILVTHRSDDNNPRSFLMNFMNDLGEKIGQMISLFFKT